MSRESLETKKSSLLFAIAAKLEEQKAQGFNEDVLKEVVKWIDACYELSAQHARFISVSHSGGATSAHVDQRIPQIKVMELHAKLALKLNDQSLVAVIQSAAAVPGISPVVFESMAALCLDSSPRRTAAAMEALTTCLHINTNARSINYVTCSALFRQLITLNGGRESAWPLYEQAYKLIEKLGERETESSAFPQIELRWLLAKAWNNGTHKYRLSKHDEAEKWMSLAFKFLQHCPAAKAESEQQMVAAYSHLLEKIAEQQHTTSTHSSLVEE